MIATTIDYQKLQDWRPNVYILPFPVVGSSSWAWSKTPDLQLELSSVIVPEIQVFPVLAATLPFSVDGHCRSHLATLYSGSSWSKVPNLSLEFRRYPL